MDDTSGGCFMVLSFVVYVCPMATRLEAQFACVVDANSRRDCDFVRLPGIGNLPGALAAKRDNHPRCARATGAGGRFSYRFCCSRRGGTAGAGAERRVAFG